MTRKILSSALVGLWLSAGLAAAHEGHEHKVMGTVSAVDAKHVEVTDKDGKKVSVQLAPDTKYEHGKMAANASHVAVGQRVVVLYTEDATGKTLTATKVMIAMPDKSQPHGH